MSTAKPFVAPGPGCWELESVHFSKPLCRFTRSSYASAFPKGFREGTARYGLLLSHFEPAFVNDMFYQKAIAFGAPPDAKGPPPKLVFQLLTRLLPSMRRRIATSQRAFEGRLWRDDLKRWREIEKPKAVRAHTKIQNVDPAALDDAALAAHVEDCLAHFEANIELHHRFTASCVAPVGDFLAHVREWTGKPVGEILGALRGSSPISNGFAAEGLDALGAALREDETARAILERTESPAAILEALAKTPGKVGERTAKYLDAIRFRCLGYDASSKLASEMPQMIVRAIRAAIAPKEESGDRKAAVLALRDAVPEERRSRFDELLDDARTVNPLRDERGHFSDGWATGLLRRALLEGGRRLHQRGKLIEPEDVVDLEPAEFAALLAGKDGPSKESIHERVVSRKARSVSDPDVPAHLGPPPAPPPPAEWLPEHGRRAHRAVFAMLDALFTEAELKRTKTTVQGLAVSSGVYEGTARLVDDEADFGRIEKGDVLVTRSTSPYFNVVLPMLGAIVTDRGGQLCHAAIVSREYGIPGVVGTREATKLVTDGARVRVDGNTGVVEVL